MYADDALDGITADTKAGDAAARDGHGITLRSNRAATQLTVSSGTVVPKRAAAPVITLYGSWTDESEGASGCNLLVSNVVWCCEVFDSPRRCVLVICVRSASRLACPFILCVLVVEHIRR